MFDHKQIEKKWQKKYEKSDLFKAEDFSDKKKFYCLIEFPYPSGEGLHMGHPRSYCALDIVSRKRRMEGYNVLYPIGWDAFGLPTENYAIKTSRKPQDVTEENINTFRRQLKSFGISFDWSREINTTDPEYYKWTQWQFLQFFKQGLAYKAKMPINWCPSCKIGLANEEVVAGECERCGGKVEKREKEQWMIAITKYADRLLSDLDTVDYLEKIKIQQREWIGRSEGAEVVFGIDGTDETFTVFTTRPDTLFGATYVVLAPEHPMAKKVTSSDRAGEVEKYIKESTAKTEIERGDAGREKTGAFTGAYAINPVNGKKLPIWIADYVMTGYGTGAIMAVPAHDERDFEFAKKFNLPIRPVVLKKQEQSRSFVMGVDESELKNLGIVIVDKTDDGFFKILIPFERIEEYKEFIRSKMSNGFWNEYSTAVGFDFIFKHKDGRLEEMGLDKETNDLIDRYGMTFNGEEPKEHPDNVYSWLAKNEFYADILIHTEDGIAINSGEFDGQSTSEFKKNIIVWLEKNGKGKAKINYKLRDWVFSRQRYWGEPIPLINCEKCGWVPVADKDLPVVLPEVEKYEPTDSGESPLASISKWVNTKCPNCKGLAKRETDTMPNWAGSSWYFLRYIDPKNKKSFADAKKLDYWMPVDWYNGGMEHTTLHLLYSRFWNKFLFDQGLVPFSEPYTKRTSHGLIMSSDGTKMSKSKGNVVNPDDIVNEYGADTLRLYEMFVGPFDQPVPWDPKGVLGVRRFLEKVWSMQEKIGSGKDEKLERELHKTIKKVSEDIESMKFNTAVAQMMKFVNEAHNSESVPRDIYVLFLTMLNPFAPHMTNEIFESLKGKDFLEKSQWPAFNPELAKDDFVEIAVQVAGKLRGTVQASPQATESEVAELAQKVENVQKYLSGSRVRRVVYVKGRMINFVI